MPAPTPTSVGNNVATSGSSLTITLTAAVAAGHSIVVGAWNRNARTISSITDTAGNTYTIPAAANIGSGMAAGLGYCLNPSALSVGNTITISFSGSITGSGAQAHHMGTTCTFDANSTAEAAGNGNISITSAGSVAADVCMFGVTAFGDTTNRGTPSGWGSTLYEVTSTSRRGEIHTRATTSAGSVTLSLSVGGDYAAAMLGVASAATGHDLTAANIEAATEVTSPTLTQTHVLAAANVEAATEVTSPTLTQTHVLAAANVEAATEVTAPTLTLAHVLAAANIEAATEVTSPTLTQTHVLAAANVEAATEVTSPTLTQTHVLAAANVEAATEVTSPTLTVGTDPTHNLLAADIEAATEISAPTLTQVHMLLAADIEAVCEIIGPNLQSGGAAANPVIVTLPPGTYTVAYADEAGVRLLQGVVHYGGIYALPTQATVYGAFAIARALTPSETINLTAFLNATRP